MLKTGPTRKKIKPCRHLHDTGRSTDPICPPQFYCNRICAAVLKTGPTRKKSSRAGTCMTQGGAQIPFAYHNPIATAYGRQCCERAAQANQTKKTCRHCSDRGWSTIPNSIASHNCIHNGARMSESAPYAEVGPYPEKQQKLSFFFVFSTP